MRYLNVLWTSVHVVLFWSLLSVDDKHFVQDVIDTVLRDGFLVSMQRM